MQPGKKSSASFGQPTPQHAILSPCCLANGLDAQTQTEDGRTFEIPTANGALAIEARNKVRTFTGGVASVRGRPAIASLTACAGGKGSNGAARASPRVAFEAQRGGGHHARGGKRRRARRADSERPVSAPYIPSTGRWSFFMLCQRCSFASFHRCHKKKTESNIRSVPNLGCRAKRTVAGDATRVELDLPEESAADIHASILRHGHLAARNHKRGSTAEGGSPYINRAAGV